MSTAAAWRGKGFKIFVAATVTLLLAMGVMAIQASPAFASGTVTVFVQGKGDVTGDGVNCNESGGPDCSEFYDDVVVGQGECDTSVRPPVCEDITEPPQITFTAGPDRNGYALEGWTGCDSTTGRTCSVTVEADRGVTARFRDAQGPSVNANNGTVTVAEGQTAINAGTYSDNAGGNVSITASRGTVTKTGTSSGTWSWSQATTDGPAQSGPVTISATDSSGNLSTAAFSLTVNNVAPTATLNAPQTSYANKTFLVSMSYPSDPSSADTNAGFTYAFDCGSGYSSFTSAEFVSCQSGTATKTVKGKVRDKDGGETEYTRTVTVNAAPPSHPNGKIAFISFRDGNNQEIYTMSNADGSGLRRLTYTAAQEANVAYSRDGKKIAYDREGEIYVMNANGTDQTRLTNVSGSDILPAFSPDGSKIAFQSNRNGFGEIYVMNADGSDPTRLTNNDSTDTDPAFSPNGSQIAFTTSREGSDEIYVMNTDGTGQTSVVNNPAGDLDPTYSAFDGSRIAFQSNRNGNDEIFAMHLGSNQVNLTNDPATDVQPDYAPSSFQMAFASTRNDDNWDIYKMDDFNGANPTRLTDNPALDVDPSWGGAGDGLPPQTIITSGPSNSSFSNSTSATFGFQSGFGETSPAFECQLDGGAFEPCTSTRTYSNLAAGEHTFRVQAIDTSGNVDTTPEVRTWTVDLTAPTVTGMTPTDGTLGVLEGTNATATFSEAMNATTLNGTTFTLTRQNAASPVAATVSYDAATNTATLNPNADLDSLATYTVLVKGGSGGVKDRAGNPLSLDRTWNFRTGDTRPPDVSLTSPANGTTVGTTVQLAANATDTGVMKRVEFLVNGSVVDTDLTAPYAVQWSSAGFANGSNVQITARAIDEANNQAASAARTVTVDNQAPAEPTITNRPNDPTNSPTASWTFSSEPGATFRCSIDDPSNFLPCTSGQSFPVQSDGTHTFRVRAVDGAGNAGPDAQDFWTLDTAGPETSLGGGPDGPTNDDSPSFTFSSEPGATFRCKLTGPSQAHDFSACSSPAPYTDLAEGEYTFEVRAVDAAGNADEPISRSFTVDTTAPAAPTVTGDPAQGTTSRSRSASFTFSSEPGAAFQCKLDAAQFAACSSPQAYSDLTDRGHNFSVRARDAAGNQSDPAVHRWTVDTTGPTIKNWAPRGTGVSSASRPAVTFSEAMNETLLEKSANGIPTTFFLKKGKTRVAATVSYVETETATGAKVYKAILTPGKRLSRRTTYTVTVTTAATDAAGNPLGVIKTWKFTVK